MSLFNISLGVLMLAGCAPEADYENTMKPTIQEVKKLHETEWLSRSEVVSIGIGLNKEKQAAIIIGVNQLTPSMSSAFPASLEDYPVELQLVGEIKAQQ